MGRPSPSSNQPTGSPQAEPVPKGVVVPTKSGDVGRNPPPDVGGYGEAAPDSIRREKALFGCFRRRQAWCLTWRGLVLLGVLLIALGVAAVHEIHPFLAVTRPIPANILIVEGWGPDFAMKAATEEFSRSHYDKLYVTGGPLEWGAPLSEHSSYAQLGAAILEKLGMSPGQVQPVPAPLVQQDRTYISAVALRKYLDAHGVPHPAMNLISIGPHARRSRLMFEKAFGKGTKIGIVALEPHDYNPRRWWHSSQGVRGVLSETFAYAYARLFFWPKADTN